MTFWPSSALPDGSGCFVLAGMAPGLTIVPVAPESAWFEPSVLVAVTWTRIVLPASPFETT